ncbi:MAG TPA: division/cell wall cluster transcriptional repressor MraZ [Candidatus Binataceae bacterium]|nr:division/cell wall cluster transcriptional repressor MraZ [Candidatus Binataceae bacterium]
MFSGRFDHAIDAKGRVSIPVRFREVLQKADLDRLFITNFILSNEPCLALYPPDEWWRLVAKVRQRPSFDRNVQLFQTFYLGGAHEVEVDNHGRIVIPPKLRQFAHLDKDVTFSAMTDHFQLWDKATLDRVLGEAMKNFADPNFLNSLGL